jgi:hypothetical protein
MLGRMPTNIPKQYIFIIQFQDTSECKVGLTDYLDATTKTYNDTESDYRFIYICEVREMIDI